MNILSKNFLEFPTEANGFKLVSTLRQENLFTTAILVGTFLSELFPYSPNIRTETAVSAYYLKKYELSYDLYNKNLELLYMLDEK